MLNSSLRHRPVNGRKISPIRRAVTRRLLKLAIREAEKFGLEDPRLATVFTI